ncbi:MAG: hypothetical protein CTY36_08880 [Methylocystis sp.]|nr:MAG: hypothetical protein CTY36_08880 [Methylocystis sp.]
MVAEEGASLTKSFFRFRPNLPTGGLCVDAYKLAQSLARRLPHSATSAPRPALACDIARIAQDLPAESRCNGRDASQLSRVEKIFPSPTGTPAGAYFQRTINQDGGFVM